jgi:hypothetical protein
VAPELLQVIASHTNENESIHYENKTEHSEKERAWHDLSAADVGAFIGAAMLMGVHPQSNLHNYWSDSDDKPIYPLEKYISRQRFQQISRFLKVNNPHEDEGDEFWHKVEPLSSSFREACQRLLILGDTFSIDENLIAARTRSGHLMEVKNKAAGKGYKIYSLALQHYLFDWIYTSKKTPVAAAKNYIPQSEGYEDDAFTDTERTVLTLVEAVLATQPEGHRFQIVFDNFFTSTRLFDELRAWGIGAYGTARAGTMTAPHLAMDLIASKEKHYGEIINTVGKGINYITYIDQDAVWMLSTVHDVANQPPCWRPAENRVHASHHLAQENVDGNIEIPYPQISRDYNYNMNGSDICQQVWNKYTTARHCHRRNWWPLFWHIIDASISNCLFIYRLKGYTDRQISHFELQERLGLQLLRNPAAVTRVHDSTSTSSKKRSSLLKRPIDEHKWTRFTKRYCVVHKPYPKTRGPGRRSRKATQLRNILQELHPNTTPIPSGKRKRTKQTTWGCSDCGVALCKSTWCWQQHHGEIEQENQDESELEPVSFNSQSD